VLSDGRYSTEGRPNLLYCTVLASRLTTPNQPAKQSSQPAAARVAIFFSRGGREREIFDEGCFVTAWQEEE